MTEQDLEFIYQERISRNLFIFIEERAEKKVFLRSRVSCRLSKYI